MTFEVIIAKVILPLRAVLAVLAICREIVGGSRLKLAYCFKQEVVNITVSSASATTITGYRLAHYSSFWAEFCKRESKNMTLPPITPLIGSDLMMPPPHFLEAGADWRGRICETEKIYKLLESGRLWVLVHANYKDKPDKIRLKAPKGKKVKAK